MFLVDKPYISPFLAATLKAGKHKVISTKEAIELLGEQGYHWVSEEEAIDELSNQTTPLLYTNSENSVAWLSEKMRDHSLTKQVNILKDKFAFRELLKSVYPNYNYQRISFQELQSLESDSIMYPCVIKPSIGFFSIGVHVLHDPTDFEEAKRQLNSEKVEQLFPEAVVNTSHFIIEEYIDGKEFAVDSYVNEVGEIIILSILEHTFKSETDTSDRMYITSVELIRTYQKEVVQFLEPIVDKLQLKNFPFHTEFRITSKGEFIPIEINPMRYGGWCTTADLNWFAYGINSYEAYLFQQRPNWDEVIEQGRDRVYSLVLLDNVTDHKLEEIDSFDFDRFEKDYQGILELRKLDIRKYPLFGFLFIELASQNSELIEDLLHQDFTNYIKLK